MLRCNRDDEPSTPRLRLKQVAQIWPFLTGNKAPIDLENKTVIRFLFCTAARIDDIARVTAAAA
jgi:hypothetical protein